MESIEPFTKLITMLGNKKMPFKVTEHEPVTTSEEAAKVRGATLESGAKAMIVKSINKSKIAEFSLLVFSASKKITWPPIKKALSSKNVSIAPIDEVSKLTVRFLLFMLKWSNPSIWLNVWTKNVYGSFFKSAG